ncbi:F-Box Only Protein 38 [Manis pentadactyla]|nr:F-Box Only Protein 38 [Manis pentadactyla]
MRTEPRALPQGATWRFASRREGGASLELLLQRRPFGSSTYNPNYAKRNPGAGSGKKLGTGRRRRKSHQPKQCKCSSLTPFAFGLLAHKAGLLRKEHQANVSPIPSHRAGPVTFIIHHGFHGRLGLLQFAWIQSAHSRTPWSSKMSKLMFTTRRPKSADKSDYDFYLDKTKPAL